MRTCTTSTSPWRRNAAIAGILIATLIVVAGSACSSGDLGGPVPDTSLESLALTDVQPTTVVPGTTLVLEGRSFVDAPWGVSRLRFQGTYAGSSIDVAVPARFVDYDRMEITVDSQLTDALGGDMGEFSGDVTLEVDSSYDGKTYSTDPLPLSLRVERQLSPRLDILQSGGVIFVNDEISVQGGGLLLGGDEGTTFAVVDGCFTPEGDTVCTPVSRTDVPVVPESPFDRTRGTFMFRPAIAGIQPGAFTGTVELRNDHTGGASPTSASRTANYDIIRSTIFSIGPSGASLGQYVMVEGGGFVGEADNGDTLVQMQGNFSFDGGGPTVPVDLLLVPEFVDGGTVRYVLNEDDTLGQSIDLRANTGEFTGTVAPIVSHGGDEVTGDAIAVSLRIEPVKQVVFLDFRPSYVESLRSFGLRAMDAQIRERILEVNRRDYATLNVEFRTERPDDFALYAVVEIAGPDPNGLGLLGYDNTPGKDTGNQRLYDRIGGVSAVTQEDGFPGFGGVFIESMFGFSEHPNGLAMQMPSSDPAFDDLFDPFRPDRGGKPVIAADVADGVPSMSDGAACPADDRGDQIGCAVFVLGSLIGTTTSHELGHSLGLANPYGEGFHNSGDAPNRLMDPGASRSFQERAELFGQGPAKFCVDEYDYMRQILPTSDPDDGAGRPDC